jgi:Fic family protein
MDNSVDNCMDNIKVSQLYSGMESRKYEASHPWLTFDFDSKRLGRLTWAHLGECFSKCQHLVGTPLKPAVADKLAQIYLRRGALASAAIEGNSLSEVEVSQILDQKKKLPESQQYLESEIRNIIHALDDVKVSVLSETKFKLTPEWILQVHAELLEGLEVPEYVTPGQTRKVSVVVGNYKGVPAEDVDFLIQRLCDWVNTMLLEIDKEKTTSPDMAFVSTFFVAILAHLYIAWIHPFGDGNGRTARVIECAIFAHSELVPWISTNLLSDYFNRTRSKYYERLEATSRNDDVTGFIAYSAIGLRDQLRDQVIAVQSEQKKVAWVNYVHEVLDRELSTTSHRRRKLVLAMPDSEELSAQDIQFLSPAIASNYGSGHEKTFKRDLNRVIELGLLEKVDKNLYRVRIDRMNAFTPRPENSRETSAMKIKKTSRRRKIVKSDD